MPTPHDMRRNGKRFNWNRISTVLLDMDGTLLDKYYDDYFWEQFLPEVYGHKNGLDVARARQELFKRYRSVKYTLMWTDLDYWSETLGLDIVSLKKKIDHLIAVLPHVNEFLAFLKEQNKSVYLVTAAHQKSVDIKMDRVNLRHFFDRLICADELGKPKEDRRFWQELEEQLDFDRSETLFADDNLDVLRAARGHGIRHLVHMARPSSKEPVKYSDDYPSIATFGELMEGFSALSHNPIVSRAPVR